MSTITCSSCGMEYDGSGLQAGVQFQCTQCGEMVMVGAPAQRAPGRKRPTGRPRAGGGAPGRGPGRGPGGPGRAARPMAGGPQRGGEEDGQPAYGPPPSGGGNVGLIIGIVAGLVVVGLIVAAVVLASGPTPQDHQKEKQQAKREAQKERVRQQDAETLKQKEMLEKPLNATAEYGPTLEAALTSGDSATLSGMFDWQLFAAYNKDQIAGDAGHLTGKMGPLIAVGSWAKKEDGTFSGLYEGQTARGPDSLRERVIGYVEEFVFGQSGLKWLKEASMSDGSQFTLIINDKKYIGRKMMVTYKGAGDDKQFWLAAPEGGTDVRIVNYVDKGSFKNLQGIEAKNPKRDNRDPYNPDRDPRNPDSNPGGENDPPVDPDANLPQVAKTGKYPTAPALVNAVKELERGGSLNQARLGNIRKEPSKAEKHATMGALIDLLITAVTDNDRTMKMRLSNVLWDVWNGFVPTDWGEDEMTYGSPGMGGGQSTSDITVRRWLEVYNSYPLDD